MTPTDLERSALLTDADRMRDVFQAALPGFGSGGLLIDGCRIVHTRYRTSRAERREGKAFLSVCYALDVRDLARARRGTQLVHGKAYGPADSRRRFAEAKARHRFEPSFGEAVAHLADLDLVVWAFPNDPKLPHLPEVIDPRAVKRHLPYDRLPAGLDAAAHIHEVDVEVVRYKPEVRCITRYQLAGAERQAFTLYGKTFKHERAREIARRIQSIWRRSADDPDGFIVPQPLGHDDAVRTVWQAALSGTPLIDVVQAGRLGVFAFDNFTLGDPARDLANFIVDLRYQGFPAGLVTSMTTTFLDAYRSHAEWDMPSDRLRWHTAVQGLSDAYYFHKRRHLAPGFEAELERILALAEDQLRSST